jgi:hypothetical protein
MVVMIAVLLDAAFGVITLTACSFFGAVCSYQIFIDYGEDWEEAWNDHVEHWTSPCQDAVENCLESSRLVSVTMNQDRHNPQYHAWSDVHLTACQSNFSHPWESGGKVIYLTNSTTIGESITLTEFLGFSHNDDGFDYPFLPLSNLRPCKILQSKPEADTFDVVYFFQTFQVPNQYRNDTTTRILVHYEGLPSFDLHFLNKPLKGDLHDPRAFRHEIHIPDESFPPLWKDIK